MKAPAFWWRPAPGLAAAGLAPIGALYGAVTAARMARPGRACGVPVLCIGNFVAGGAGKTPAAIAIARLLQGEGRRPAFVSRGYGRRPSPVADQVLLVDADRHDAATTGDEPLLLARTAPTLVSRDRVRAAEAAMAAGADCLILDDGLQNPALAKDWSLVVADGATGIGNGLCVPAGPLRAPLARQWPAVSMLAVVDAGDAGQRLVRAAQGRGIATMGARLVPDAATIARWRGRRLLAFAGIGRPEKFFTTLRDAGLDLVGTRSFSDHHAFLPSECADLAAAAAAARATLVTTAKDRVRLPPGFGVEELPVDLVFDDPAAMLSAIRLRA